MASSRPGRPRRLLIRVLLTAALVALVAAAAFVPFAGGYLIAEDPLEKSDAILVLAGARVERWLEAVDLYKEGWAPRIVLSRGRHDAAEQILAARGIHYPDDGDLARDAMTKLEVPPDRIVLFPTPVDNTAQEAMTLQSMAAKNGWKTLIVVTSKFHTRRTGFAFRRQFAGTSSRVVIRASRYDESRAERWWQSRRDLRLVTYELQKLIAYRLGLGG
jgi:uncharacterized SAM-binding protein YcdF (DUF218 family)